MTEDNKAAITTVKDNGDVVVDANGTEVVIHRDGTTNLAPANDAAAAQVALVLGQKMADQSVYIGQYAPKDRDGNSLGKIFNVFAAPGDLGGTDTYVDTVKHIARLKAWNGFYEGDAKNGHDGTNYANDTEIYQALKDGSYNGGWIIPTRDLLSGKDVDGNKTQSGNLLAAYNKAVLKGIEKTETPPLTSQDFEFTDSSFKRGQNSGALKTSSGSDSCYPNWYWSSTENRPYPYNVLVVHLSGGYENWEPKGDLCLSCRPVRLVACKAP